MSRLFEPLTIRSITLPNRIVVSPMCQYSYTDGLSNDWQFIHLASRAVGGAGLVMAEATAVVPEGRISPEDAGIWSEAHTAGLQRITAFIKEQGSAAGIQLAHAGRKASTYAPWRGRGAVPVSEGGWEVVGPSAISFSPDYPEVTALDQQGIDAVIAAFAAAADRAVRAGFEVIEIHAAHSYLLHQFLSPLSNQRSDSYGGSLENRSRLLMQVIAAVRSVIGTELPLWVRLSATDWTPGGWDIEESVTLSRMMKSASVDLVDVSTGGNVAGAKIPLGPGYQVPFATTIRREAGIATGAVGLITTAAQAEAIVRDGEADVVLLARELLRDPYWPLHAAQELGVTTPWPAQYLRAAPTGSPQRR
jgi:2,4-dienoyl-CoA reductase-like NADH-dependent reductase (Old Yellow Enzyme family)